MRGGSETYPGVEGGREDDADVSGAGVVDDGPGYGDTADPG